MTESELHMHSGPIHMKLPLAKIRAIRPVGAVASSFAGWSMGWSLDVILVERNDEGFGYRITPRDRARFLDCLAGRCPHLRRTSDGLAPA